MGARGGARLRFLVALAGKRFEALAVDDAYDAPAIRDDSGRLQFHRRFAHARPRSSEHRRERFVWEPELILPSPVMSEQQPARKALGDGMKRIASYRAACEMKAESAVAEKGAAEVLMQPAKIEKLLGADEVALAGKLDDLACIADRRAQEDRHPDETVATHRRGLGLLA